MISSIHVHPAPAFVISCFVSFSLAFDFQFIALLFLIVYSSACSFLICSIASFIPRLAQRAITPSLPSGLGCTCKQQRSPNKYHKDNPCNRPTAEP